MWRKVRYFDNPYPKWKEIDETEKKDSGLDDLMFISSKVSSNDHGLKNIYTYTLNNIIRLFNQYTLQNLNTQQKLFAKRPSTYAPVDGTIYVGIHGISVLLLRILLLIDNNDITDDHVNPKGHKQSPINCDNYKASKELLVRFIYDLCTGLKAKTIEKLRQKLLFRIEEYIQFILNPQIKYQNSWDDVTTLVLGKTGIISVAVVVSYITKNIKKFNRYIQKLLGYADVVLASWSNWIHFMFSIHSIIH